MIQPRTPAAFFGHGNPMNALDRNRYTEARHAFGAGIEWRQADGGFDWAERFG